MSGVDEQRHDHLLPIDFIEWENWHCGNNELAYYALHGKVEEVLGHIFRPSLFYEEKSEEYLIKFFNSVDWSDIVVIKCPRCGLNVYGIDSTDWSLFTEYVKIAKHLNLIKYGSAPYVRNR